MCGREEPVLEDKGSGTHAACHFPLTRDEVDRLLPDALVAGRAGPGGGVAAGG